MQRYALLSCFRGWGVGGEHHRNELTKTKAVKASPQGELRAAEETSSMTSVCPELRTALLCG